MGTTRRILIRLLLSVVMAGSILPIALLTVPAVRDRPAIGAILAAGLIAVSFLVIVRFGPRLPR